MKACLTVYFEDPFWVGVFERIDDGKLSVCKVTFGAEPKDYPAGADVIVAVRGFFATMKPRIFYDAYEDAGFKVGAGLMWNKPTAPGTSRLAGSSRA